VNFTRFFTRPTPHDHARALGTLGGKARKDLAEQQAAMIRARTRELQRDLGWPDDPRISA
jgi:hypothetical protein